MSARPPIIGICGWKKSGKTTLSVKLIAELTQRGHRVASIEHAHHGFQIDEGEVDSARHRRAGARQVAIVSASRWAIVSELSETPEPSFDEMIAMLAPCDIVVVEGYKWEAIPKIEARRTDAKKREPLAPTDPHIIAIAADHNVMDAGSLPTFGLEDVTAIADFVVARVGPLGRSLAAR